MKRLILFLLVIGTSMNGFAQKSTDDTNPEDELQVYIPNAFTPNFDGKNDVFAPVISGPEIENYELAIYDRAGLQVFYSTDPSEVWNGSHSGGEYLTASNVYVYFLKVKSVADIETQTFKGHVVSVR